LVVIGNGDANSAKQFKENFSFQGEIYLDPKLDAYKSFKLQRGVWRTFKITKETRKMMLDIVSKKISMDKLQGDAFQQGGTFVIGPGDKLLFSYLNDHTGDHANVKDAINAGRSQ